MSELDRIIGQLEGAASMLLSSDQNTANFMNGVAKELSKLKPETQDLAAAATPPQVDETKTPETVQLPEPEPKTVQSRPAPTNHPWRNYKKPNKPQKAVKKPKGKRKEVLKLMAQGKKTMETVAELHCRAGYVYQIKHLVKHGKLKLPELKEDELPSLMHCQWLKCPNKPRKFKPEDMVKESVAGADIRFCSESCALNYFTQNGMER